MCTLSKVSNQEDVTINELRGYLSLIRERCINKRKRSVMDKTRENFSIRILHKLSLKIEISIATDNLYSCFENTPSAVTLTKIYNHDYEEQDFVNFRRKSKQPNTGSKVYLL